MPLLKFIVWFLSARKFNDFPEALRVKFGGKTPPDLRVGERSAA
jgi:hypothetical protein